MKSYMEKYEILDTMSKLSCKAQRLNGTSENVWFDQNVEYAYFEITIFKCITSCLWKNKVILVILMLFLLFLNFLDFDIWCKGDMKNLLFLWFSQSSILSPWIADFRNWKFSCDQQISSFFGVKNVSNLVQTALKMKL